MLDLSSSLKAKLAGFKKTNDQLLKTDKVTPKYDELMELSKKNQKSNPVLQYKNSVHTLNITLDEKSKTTLKTCPAFKEGIQPITERLTAMQNNLSKLESNLLKKNASTLLISTKGLVEQMKLDPKKIDLFLPSLNNLLRVIAYLMVGAGLLKPLASKLMGGQDNPKDPNAAPQDPAIKKQTIDEFSEPEISGNLSAQDKSDVRLVGTEEELGLFPWDKLKTSDLLGEQKVKIPEPELAGVEGELPSGEAMLQGSQNETGIYPWQKIKAGPDDGAKTAGMSMGSSSLGSSATSGPGGTSTLPGVEGQQGAYPWQAHSKAFAAAAAASGAVAAGTAVGRDTSPGGTAVLPGVEGSQGTYPWQASRPLPAGDGGAGVGSGAANAATGSRGSQGDGGVGTGTHYSGKIPGSDSMPASKAGVDTDRSHEDSKAGTVARPIMKGPILVVDPSHLPGANTLLGLSPAAAFGLGALAGEASAQPVKGGHETLAGAMESSGKFPWQLSSQQQGSTSTGMSGLEDSPSKNIRTDSKTATAGAMTPETQPQSGLGSGASSPQMGDGSNSAGAPQGSGASTSQVDDGSSRAGVPQGSGASSPQVDDRSNSAGAPQEPGPSSSPSILGASTGSGGPGGPSGTGPGGANDGSAVNVSAGINLAPKGGADSKASKTKQKSTTMPSGSHDNNICLGGILKCQAGAAPSPIMVMPITGMFANMIQPVADIMCFMANSNIMSFAVCMSPLHPGFIMGGPQSCSPMVTPWIPSDLAMLMAGMAPASSKDHCICMIAPGMQVKIMFPGTFNLFSLS